jgi:hypothetical protein
MNHSVPNHSEFQEYVQKLDERLEQVTALTDDSVRRLALELLQASMDLHGAVVSRIVDLLSQSSDASRSSLATLGRDPLICGLLVLYGVHPLTLDERISDAMKRLEPDVHKAGVRLELLGIQEGVVRVRIAKDHGGYSTPAENLKSTIEQTIIQSAPEATEINIEGISSSSFVPLSMILPAKEQTSYEESTT